MRASRWAAMDLSAPSWNGSFPADRTVFTGYVRGEQLAEAFASADVFAFPSDTDTFAQVVLQALASGVPPVVAAPTAPAQFVPHGRAG